MVQSRGWVRWSVAKEAESALTPLQAGVGLPGGAEAAGLAARLFAERHPDWTVLKLDLRNAYGETARARALQELKRLGTAEALALLAFCSGLMCEPTLVHFAGALIEVYDGLDQGDPAAPLLFCLALQPVLIAIREALPPGAFVGAYLDDVTIIVPGEAAGEALEIAERAAAGRAQLLDILRAKFWRGKLLTRSANSIFSS